MNPLWTLPPRRQRGVTLIELMVAMLIGLLVAGGIVSLFISTAASNRVQTQLASLQEEGRFAMLQLGNDLRMANGFYCSNMGGPAGPLSSGFSLDRFLRAPRVYLSGTGLTDALADLTTGWGVSSSNTYPVAPVAAYDLPAFFSMRGYDCTTTACAPVDPHALVPTIPSMLPTVNNRVPGADVLTVRYLDGERGWSLDGINSTMTIAGNAVTGIKVAPTATEPPLSDYSGGPLMLADCNGAQIFAASHAGGSFTPTTAGNFTSTTVKPPTGLVPKLFDFKRDFQTVTYYLKEVSDGNGRRTGALVRRLNGVDMELVRGVERLDFRYGVMDAAGNTRYLAADQVDKQTSCASTVASPQGSDPGCLWRSVQSIEVHLLMDGQVPMYTLSASEMAYTYWGDTGDAVATAAAPSAHAINPSQQGFDDHLIRREFSILVSVRNYNP